MNSPHRLVVGMRAGRLVRGIWQAIALTVVPVICPAQAASEVQAPRFDIDDTWQYAYRDALDRAGADSLRNEWVTTIHPDGSIDLARVRGGARPFGKLDAQANYIKLFGWHYEPSDGGLKFPLSVGRTWGSDIRWTLPGGLTGASHSSATVLSLGPVKVKAGDFEAFKIDIMTQSKSDFDPWFTSIHTEIWYAPSVKRIVLSVASMHSGHDTLSDSRLELLSYSLAAARNNAAVSPSPTASSANPSEARTPEAVR